MHKKVLILTSKAGFKIKYLASYLKTHLDADVRLATLSELVFDINGIEPIAFLDSRDDKLSDYDFVLFRGVTNKDYSVACSTALMLEHFKIDYADKIYQNLGSAGDKFTALIRLSFAGLPVIHSIFSLREVLGKNVAYVTANLGLPLVAKEYLLQHGAGIRTIRDSHDFEKLLVKTGESRKQFIFQKFIEIDKEYRFLVMGNKVRSVQRMYRDTSKFELVIDWNRKEEFFPVTDFPDKMINTALKAAKVLNLQVAGVDIALEKGTGKVFVFEVNRGPGFTYEKYSPEIPALAKFIDEKVRNRA